MKYSSEYYKKNKDTILDRNNAWLTAEENLKKSTHTQVNYTGGK